MPVLLLRLRRALLRDEGGDRVMVLAAPAQAQTMLLLSDPPLADTASYDRLRAQPDTQEIDHA